MHTTQPKKINNILIEPPSERRHVAFTIRVIEKDSGVQQWADTTQTITVNYQAP